MPGASAAATLPRTAAGASGDPMLPVVYEVRRARRELPDTVTLEMEPVPGEGGQAPPRMAFAPGQFNMLYAFGVGEVAISISGDPTAAGPLVHTVRAVGRVSAALCALKAGDQLGVRGPFGVPWPVDESAGQDIVVVAGGIGLAPLRPALYQVLAARPRYGKVALCYGTRTPRDLLYPKEVSRWRGRHDLQVEVTVDHASPEWQGNVGVVTTILGRVGFDPGQTVGLLCGPEVMMHFAARELLRLGVARERIYVSMERNMKCAIGLCGHCQLGPAFVCKDGPVFSYERAEPLMRVRER